MNNRDLADKEHWDNYYMDCKRNLPKNHIMKWIPDDYNSKVIELMLMTEINRSNPKTILEIGCGNSTWLPYLAKKTGARVAGIDYSEEGCNLVKERLNLENIEGEIFCEDFFQADPQKVGQYDFVYSLGVVEHFSDLKETLSAELQFVKLGGILFVEVPNLRSSIHGVMSDIYQPDLLAKHKKISKDQLIKIFKDLGLKNVEGDYSGLFSLSVVAWGKYPRWGGISKFFLPYILLFTQFVDFSLLKIKCYRGYAPIAPYIYAKGKK